MRALIEDAHALIEAGADTSAETGSDRKTGNKKISNRKISKKSE
jgi:hypothetical protein